MDFKFGSKNNWRRWLWNRIVERLDSRPADAVVYYLAGEKDLDRPVAESHGFKERNLVAVDRDERVVKKLRSSGTLAVRGDFLAHVIAAPSSLIPKVILFDTCSGLEASQVSSLGNILCDVRYQNAVVAVNFMRGRDPSTNKLRQHFLDPEGNAEKHRGRAAWLSVMGMWGVRVRSMIEKNQLLDPTDDDRYDRLLDRIKSEWYKTLPVFSSYQSTAGPYFDSAVWANTLPLFSETRLENEKIAAKYRRSLTAISAIRTMREKGKR